jgi:peptidoglycan/xylan/chitin deacetylase (PgdA/CDA1 family)
VKVVPKQDTTKPVITLKGNASMSIQLGNKFTDPGYTASDDVDGNLTSKVTVSGTVNTGKAGTYTITYTVKDAAGNKTVVSRKVQVKDPSAVPDKKVIYLTFDDGPNQNTAKLLPILKKYNVKATFFVSAQFPGYLHLLDDIVNDGHQIALHTKTHSYKQIYKSTDAFLEDLEAIQKIVFDRTGVKSMLMRFPGGSNNTVSKVSMGTLTKLVTKKGFTYFDWNVDSNDAGGARTAAKVYSNVINGCKNKKNSIVLMHDIHSHTVNAVEDILKWGIANGYTFATLDENSPNVQFTKP